MSKAAESEGRSGHSMQGRLLMGLLALLNRPRVRFILPSGESVSAGKDVPVADVKIKNARALTRLLADPGFQFAEGYTAGDIEVNGDLSVLIEEFYRCRVEHGDSKGLAAQIGSWLRRARSNTLTTARFNIHHHYDLGNAFYALWLDPTLSYTCAYFRSRQMTLEHAQVAKMHHVARKLRLRAGESVVEAGCGWGRLALTLARDYGVRVRAFNISTEQIASAREAAWRAGLDDRVEFVEDDYRNITGRYDAFVSVGMLEHVGIANYPELGRLVRRSLTSTGRGLIHTIGRNAPLPLDRWIRKRIFPGAEIPSLAQMSSIFEPNELSVLDVENLRLHYAYTLEYWRASFEGARERVAEMFDDAFVRMWRLYLAGAAAAFRTGEMQLFQVLVTPRNNNDLPLTREHLYLI